MNDMDEDRKIARQIQAEECRLVERLKQLEYVTGLTETKPQVFVDIDNALINLKIQMGQEMGAALSDLKVSVERGYIVESKVIDCERTVHSLEKLIKTRD